MILLATSASAQTYIIEKRPEPPRGKIGSFNTFYLWRVGPNPNSGIVSYYTDKLTATGEKLRPYDTKNFTCSHPDPSELGQCYMVRRGSASLRCLVNDIGPRKDLDRALDLTPAGFRALGLKEVDGLGRVDKIERCTEKELPN